MNHVVFVLGSYYPNYSAVGYCAYQVQKFLSEQFDISVIAFSDDPSLPLDDVHEGTRILRIETEDMKLRKAAMASHGKMADAQLLMLRAKGALRRLFSPETIDWNLVNAYLKKLNAMRPAPSAIVPLVFPFETILAALAYKRTHPDVLVIPYLFDDFVDSGSLHVLKIARWMKRPRHLRLEHTMLTEACAILSMQSLRPHLEANFETSLLDKIFFLEHPLLFQPAEEVVQSNDRIARLCFTGSLIKKVREPDYLLDLLRHLKPTMAVRADFYVMGNGAVKVQTGSFTADVDIVNHGRVPKARADAAVRDANILLNIGESQGKQISSKIFEYMSTGKPIIHLAYVKNDVVSKILAKYPLAMSLVQDRSRLAENADLVSGFISENYCKKLSFAEVEAIYPEASPASTGVILSKLVRKGGLPPMLVTKGKSYGG